MTKNHIENINALKDAIERMHRCKASHIEGIAVIEKYGPKTVWRGIVHNFKIEGNAKTDTCYAWSSPIEGSTKKRYYTVLKIPPIDTPEKAIRASIVADLKK